MKVLNFGSLNYDDVYTVDHILVPGETQTAIRMKTFCGGKGLNQSIALAKAGVPVWHAGAVGEDGNRLLEICRDSGVDATYVKSTSGKSGHTVIQVDTKGQNCILVFPGTNRKLTQDHIEKVLFHFSRGDMLLLQNETNCVKFLIDMAYQKGMKIAFNPSPIDESIRYIDLSKISILLLNEIEGYKISGKTDPNEIITVLSEHYPDTAVVLTLGESGVLYQDRCGQIGHGVYSVPVVDTTAAGDTFTGYFLAAVALNRTVKEALELASKASAIAVSRKGAAASIPSIKEVETYPFEYVG